MLKEMWPPSSLDLNLLDFGICSILEQKACIVSQPVVEVSKKYSIDSWDQIKTETVHATCAQVIQSVRRVIREKGKYTE